MAVGAYASDVTECCITSQDKAIDLIDEASSALRLARESRPEELEIIERTLTTLQIELSSLGKDHDEVSKERRKVLEEEVKELKSQAKGMEEAWREDRRRTEEVANLREELEKRKFELLETQRCVVAVAQVVRHADRVGLHRSGDYQRAGELRYSIIPELINRIPEDVEGDESAQLGDRVGSDDIARVVAKVRRSLFALDLDVWTRLTIFTVGYWYPNLLPAQGRPVPDP